EKFCQSFDYLISDFSYHTDEFFNDIDEWFKQLPFGQRLPLNYENLLEMLYSSVLNHKSFNNIEGFEKIKTKIKQIYLKKERKYLFYKYSFLIIITVAFLSGCDYSTPQNKSGFFYNTFAAPMDYLLHWLGSIFDNNYGLAIIAIVLIVRIIML